MRRRRRLRWGAVGREAADQCGEEFTRGGACRGSPSSVESRAQRALCTPAAGARSRDRQPPGIAGAHTPLRSGVAPGKRPHLLEGGARGASAERELAGSRGPHARGSPQVNRCPATWPHAASVHLGRGCASGGAQNVSCSRRGIPWDLPNRAANRFLGPPHLLPALGRH
ncbi:uncharacterized protein LOC118572248 isoform X2 [Onychomys torridus]|uniref:uncharacterized protein LOC118572248 isoform X2 n=1 Tax=Onychomys torridus TaxID=38674 RepID=UPI00167F6D6E|nr:uncharacterized protein LOC118572248 isoform X2 [Onychomys torridus]